MVKVCEKLISEVNKSTALRISIINSILFIAIFVLVAVFGLVANFKSYMAGEDDSIESYMSVSMIAVDGKVQDMERLALMSMTAYDTQNILQKYATESVTLQNADEKFLSDYYASLITIRDDIKGIYLFDLKGLIFSYDSFNPSRNREIDALDELIRQQEKGNLMPACNSYLITTGLTDLFRYSERYSLDHEYNTELWLLKEVNSFSPHEKIGTIIMSMSSKTYQDLLTQTMGEDIQYVLCGDDGMILSCNDADLIGKNIVDFGTDMKTLLGADAGDVEWQGEKCHFKHQKSAYSGLHLIVGKTQHDLFAPVKRVFLVSIPLLLLAMCAVILASFRHVKKVLEPMSELSAGMRNFDENSLRLKYQVTSEDEVGVLISSFNKMVEMIRELIDEKLANEIRLKERQLTEQKLSMLYLKSQINPHFLYNTIDTIRIQAGINGDKQVADLLMKLVNFFRLSVRVDEQLVTLDHEYEMIESYLELMCYRYPQLQSSVDMDPMLADLYVPNFILQPIVENSLLHGLKGAGYKGSVSVLAKWVDQNRDLIEIQVTDTGVGFTDEVKNKVTKLLTDGEQNPETIGSNSGIGIVNVQKRIKLLCGDACGLWYTDRAGGGVTAHILLTAKREVH